MSEDFDRLAAAKYISVTTFRRDGRAVATPVWVVGVGDALYCYSAGDAGKVKRIRANPRVHLAPCTFKGVALGETREGEGALCDDAGERRRAFSALARKYGVIYRVLSFFSFLAGRIGKRAVLRLTLAPAEG
ncbi:MAG: PPOX class F420-dependent oxidoreductase [bacterium]